MIDPRWSRTVQPPGSPKTDGFGNATMSVSTPSRAEQLGHADMSGAHRGPAQATLRDQVCAFEEELQPNVKCTAATNGPRWRAEES